MKQTIKKLLIRIIQPLNKRLGLGSFQRELEGTKDSLMTNFLQLLVQFEFEPKHIVDIGANHGTWTREVIKYFPTAQYTLLEPQEWLKASFEDLLNKHEITFFPFGAGAKKGIFQFTLHERDDSSSFRYTKEEAQYLGLKQIEIPIVTINDLLSESNLPTPDIIKIDAEGLDLEVLEGCSNYFGKTDIFLVEASVMNKTFKNDLLNVIIYMNNKGYTLFEFTDLNRPFHRKGLWLVEMAFVKKGSLLDSITIEQLSA